MIQFLKRRIFAQAAFRAGVVPGAYKVTLGLGRRPQKELDKYRTANKTPLAVVVPEEGLTDMVIELK